MKKYLLILTCFILASCGKPLEKKNDVLFNNPDADFDLDGQSNIEEINLGQNPYVNSSLVKPTLKSRKTKLSIYLETQSSTHEVLNFLSVNESQRYFDEYLVLSSSIVSRPYSKKSINKIDETLYFKSIYKCITKDEMRKLKIKRGNFSVLKSTMFTSFNSEANLDEVNFYVYNFDELSPLYFQRDSGDYDFKSYSFNLSNETLDNGFCILYDNKNQRSAVNVLKTVFIYRNNKLEKNFVDKTRLSGLVLNQTFDLESFIKRGSIYYPSDSTDKTFFSYEGESSLKNSKIYEDVRVGDELNITRYIKSRTKYRSLEVGHSNSQSSRFRSLGVFDTLVHYNTCKHYQSPNAKSEFSYSSLEDLLAKDFELIVGKAKVLPIYLSDFYVTYKFEVTEKMFIDNHFNIKLKEESISKRTFSSTHHSKAPHGQNCIKKFSHGSTSSDIVEFESELYVDRLESL